MKFGFLNMNYPIYKYCKTRIQILNGVRLFDNLSFYSQYFFNSLPLLFIELSFNQGFDDFSLREFLKLVPVRILWYSPNI